MLATILGSGFTQTDGILCYNLSAKAKNKSSASSGSSLIWPETSQGGTRGYLKKDSLAAIVEHRWAIFEERDGGPYVKIQ